MGMAEDASLEEFAADGEDDEGVAPARPTLRSTPDGEPCADCGRSVRRLWLDGERFVCPDCKVWGDADGES